MRVAHVISGLRTGGAETMLLRLLRTMDRDRFDPTVIALTAGGDLASEFAALGVPVHTLDLASPVTLPRALLRLRRLARDAAPDVVQGWMSQGNLAALLAARWAPGHPALCWNIRNSMSDPGREKATIRLAVRLGGRFARRPQAVIHNAAVSIANHQRRYGYDPANAVHIPNGFDLDRFRPDRTAGARLRARLGLAEDTVLIGGLGRLHPVKGHDVLLAAAVRLCGDHPQVHLLDAGAGVTAEAPELAALATAPAVAGRVHLLGPEPEPAGYLAGLDLFCLPSRSEGFPNALGEAMACGVPCVTTDVGEAALMVGDLGLVVPPDDPAALARGLAAALAWDPAERARRGAAGRDLVAARYGLDRIAARYAELYAGLAGEGAD